MQVQALVGFAAVVAGQPVAVRAGEVVELPAGADWLTAGLVVPLRDEPVETASLDAAPGVEHAVTRKRRVRNE